LDHKTVFRSGSSEVQVLREATMRAMEKEEQGER